MTRMHALILFAGFITGYVTRWLQQPRVEQEPLSGHEGDRL